MRERACSLLQVAGGLMHRGVRQHFNSAATQFCLRDPQHFCETTERAHLQVDTDRLQPCHPSLDAEQTKNLSNSRIHVRMIFQNASLDKLGRTTANNHPWINAFTYRGAR